MVKQNIPVITAFSLICLSGALWAADDTTVLWDENTQADLSSRLGEPTIFTISEPGAYVLRLTTGPLSPEKVDGPVTRSAPARRNLQRMDANGDKKLQRSELTPGSNIGLHFDVYDVDGNGEVSLEEMGQFRLSGDGSDLFSFQQADGINLISMTINSYDSGGPNNDVTALGFMDEKTGEAVETPGVQLRDTDDMSKLRRARRANVNSVNPNVSGGVEVYEQFDLWKTYRRNDETIYFRAGEGQEKALTEVTFVFE
jgi:hypothetical protein